jgi:hypothetical protein
MIYIIEVKEQDNEELVVMENVFKGIIDKKRLLKEMRTG